ncbi:hypothetical protein E2986_14127 [Frieseomelitta varia]|uniref:Uncharacterized protein n=1 Tax=Frieseomelitta varia TaxID=561572 RepID=A0A833RHY7_9HYME|nr:hypothetical protein E2986_14127 [Frieseomelitta varia]
MSSNWVLPPTLILVYYDVKSIKNSVVDDWEESRSIPTSILEFNLRRRGHSQTIRNLKKVEINENSGNISWQSRRPNVSMRCKVLDCQGNSPTFLPSVSRDSLLYISF